MDKLLKPAEVAELLGVSVKFIYSAAEAGRLPHVKVSRLLRFDPAAVEAWIASNSEAVR